MKNFKELRIWQKGFEIATQSFNLTKTFPITERFGLSIQITRADVSIPSNIAEGSSRTSEKDYIRFLEIALGSGFELETQLLIAKSVDFGEKIMIANLLQSLNEEQRMIAAFIRSIKTG